MASDAPGLIACQLMIRIFAEQSKKKKKKKTLKEIVKQIFLLRACMSCLHTSRKAHITNQVFEDTEENVASYFYIAVQMRYT